MKPEVPWIIGWGIVGLIGGYMTHRKNPDIYLPGLWWGAAAICGPLALIFGLYETFRSRNGDSNGT